MIINSQTNVCKIGFLSIKTNGLEFFWVHSFFVNQLTAMLLPDSNVLINLATGSLQGDRVLSSLKLCMEAISMEKNKSLTKNLNKTGPSIEPYGTTEMISYSCYKY